MECTDLEVFGVWSWYVKQKPPRPVSRGEEVEVVVVTESDSRLWVVFVLMCKDRRTAEPSLRCVIVFTFVNVLPDGGLVLVCVVVCLWFECSLPYTDRPSSRLIEFKSWAESHRSPPHRRRWRSSSYHAWEQKDRQSSQQVSCCT